MSYSNPMHHETIHTPPKCSNVDQHPQNSQVITMPTVRIVHNKLLGGWFIVRGPRQAPIGGRFESRTAALTHLNRVR